MKFSDRGIPILDVDAKLDALEYCLSNNKPEDILGHAFDIMADIRKQLRKCDIANQDWSREILLGLFAEYGTSDTSCTGYLFQLMALAHRQLRKAGIFDKDWSKEVLVELFDRYGNNPTPITRPQKAA
jgi:hypothetical protein